MLNGLVQCNIELTSRCNKNCNFCGRREREKLYGDQNYGDMDFSLLKKIAFQLPQNTIVALHNNGEALLYPELKSAIKVFKNFNCFVYTVSNGKLLMDRYDDIVNNLDQISISVIENDDKDERELQYEMISKFLEKKGDLSPFLTLRFVGNIENEGLYSKLNVPIVRRTVHLPKGSVGYRKEPMKPEFLVCWDLLSRLAINRYGDISMCVRFDPCNELVLGNIKDMTISEAWNSRKRIDQIKYQVCGERVGYCGHKCSFWGVPTC